MQHHLRRLAAASLLLLPLTALADVSYLQSLSHWAKSCRQLQRKHNKHWHYHRMLRGRWHTVCQRWQQTHIQTEPGAKRFFQHHFNKHFQLSDDTLITGYYAPVFHACWQKQPYCEVPILGLPKQKHLQGLSRKAINHLTPYRFPIIAWTSRVDRYFLQVQGSGELVFNSGDRLYLGYAGKNHLPYTSIGRYLYLSKKLQKHELNMPGILHYLAAHPKQQQAIFEHNPSFVFFKTKPSGQVVGLMGVELQKELSAAVDNHWIPLGALIDVRTTNPITHQPWHLLLTAQDTGSAIRGRHHIDIYMGKGKAAGKIAGSMKQSGKITYFTPE